jgi:ADP-ribosylglycohydrolase
VKKEQEILGALLGTAVGDSLGLPREGISARRAKRIFGDAPLHQRFIFGRGMMSDDTEHTCMVGQALLAARCDLQKFVRSFAWRLRLWILGLPAGVGLATARSIIRMWLGFPPSMSGVYSAGNGPAMRAALLGVCLGDDDNRLRSFIRASTRVTHTDPRAERGALLVAIAAHRGALPQNKTLKPSDMLILLREDLGEIDTELDGLLTKMKEHLDRNAPPYELADALGLKKGVSGYVYHTVPIAIYCWLRSPNDFRQAIESVVALGGDTDTTGAIVGGIAGAALSESGIPAEWIEGLWEWPRSVRWMRELAHRLAEDFGANGDSRNQAPVPLFWPGLIPRNLLFLAVVLFHGFRRLLPPY